MVYTSLLKGGSMHQHMIDAKLVQIRGFSGNVGEHVLSLPIFQNTAALDKGLLIIECKTPGTSVMGRFWAKTPLA